MQLLRRELESSKVERESSPNRWLENSIPRAFAWFATTLYGLTGDFRSWLPLLMRASAHLMVILVAMGAIGLSGIEWPAKAAPTLSTSAMPASAGDGKDARGNQVSSGIYLYRLTIGNRSLTRKMVLLK